MATVTSKNGQTLDDIAYQMYGDAPYMLAPLVALNPHAVAQGPYLPAGLSINLPALLTQSSAKPTINLWD